MIIFYILIGIYLGVGFLYSLWIWLFRYGTFLSIIPNTLFGLPYILLVVWQAFSYKRFSFHDLFKHKKAVIFDLDGTIIDSQPYWNAAVENVKRQVQLGGIARNYPPGLNVQDKWLSILKDAKDSGVSVSLSKLIAATKREVLSTYTEVEAMPGFWDLAKYLKEKGFKLALASNTDKDLVDELLQRLGAKEGVFDIVLTGSDVKNRKPNPEMYQQTLKLLKVKAKDTVAFEDTIVGCKSSIGAGIDTVIIWDGEVAKVEYPKEVKTFVSDYVGVDNEIEFSPQERLEKAKEFAKENGIDL